MVKFVDKYLAPAWNLLNKDLITYGIISILAYVALFVLVGIGTVALLLGMSGGAVTALLTEGVEEVAATGLSFGALIGGIVMVTLSVIGSAYYYGVLIRTALDSPKIPDVEKAMNYGIDYLMPLIILGVVLIIVLSVGYAIFIIPGLILSILFAISPIVLVAETVGPVDAMRRSYHLILNDVWGAILSYVVFIIVVGILNAVPVVNLIVTILSPVYLMLLSVVFYRKNSK